MFDLSVEFPLPMLSFVLQYPLPKFVQLGIYIVILIPLSRILFREVKKAFSGMDRISLGVEIDGLQHRGAYGGGQ
jgi:hypothetical protein